MNNVHELEAERLEGVLDSAYLFSYAVFMFFRYLTRSQSYDFGIYNYNAGVVID
jgi:hypothetical protein